MAVDDNEGEVIKPLDVIAPEEMAPEVLIPVVPPMVPLVIADPETFPDIRLS